MKLNLNSAIKGSAPKVFKPFTITTLDFGRLQPVQAFDVLPGDDFNVQGHGCLRLTPQVFPAYGRCNLKNASFFVPENKLISWSEGFHANNDSFHGADCSKIPTLHPWFMNYWFAATSSTRDVVANNPDTAPSYGTFDFAYPVVGTFSTSKTNAVFYKLNASGQRICAILKALGYDFANFDCNGVSSSTTQTTYLDARGKYDDASQYHKRISALPLLAYLKIYADYFLNNTLSNTSALQNVLYSVYCDKAVSYNSNPIYTAGTWKAVRNDIVTVMVAECLVPYESNMYTTAWDNANSPTSISSINQQTSPTNVASLSAYGANTYGESGGLVTGVNRTYHQTSSSSSPFSAFGHNALMAFDKFVKRHNLVGYEAVKQIYAQFGIKTSDWDKTICTQLCEGSSRINFSAVVSNSDTKVGTTGKLLGDYTGIGLGGYDVKFSYRSRDYGYIISLVWMNIDPVKSSGLRPFVQRIRPFDYYTPEWDGKAMRAIPHREVVGGSYTNFTNRPDFNAFGYTNVYDEYRNMPDIVAGRFALPTQSERHFAFTRDFSPYYKDLMAYTPQATSIQYYGRTYPRVDESITNPFVLPDTTGDRFYFVIDWEIGAKRPCLDSEDTLDLTGKGSIALTKNGEGLR